MARITEHEITDVDGSIKKVRTIEADRIRVEHPDGTVEELENLSAPPKAEEWPWPLPQGPAEWRLSNVPLDKVIRMGLQAMPKFLTLLSENGEPLLKLGSITLGGQFSANGQDLLMGNEIPLDDP